MKRILLLSIPAGSGHTRAAEALEAYAQTHLDASVVHADVSAYTSKTLTFVHMGMYLFLRKHARALWGFLYYVSNNKKIANRLNRTHTLQKHSARDLIAYIKKQNPDIIICTYFGIGQMISSYVQSHNIPMYIVLTDYHTHALSCMQQVSGYFVATEEMKHELMQYGAQEKHVHVTGIPVHPAFQNQDIETGRSADFEIPTENKIILLIANMYTDREIRIILKSLSRIKNVTVFLAGTEKNYQTPDVVFHLIPLGWSNDIHRYIKLSDLVITKSGGLIVSECIALKTPMIIPLPFPGQEYENAKYIEAHDLGSICRDIKKIDTMAMPYLFSNYKFPSFNPQTSDPNAKIFDVLLDTKTL